MSARLSIQIVTWNSAKPIGACLLALLAQDSRDFEVVVVDNASADDSAAQVAAALARGLPGTLVRAPRNLGFCGGQNRALQDTRGAWVLFLNPDAELPPSFVREALACATAQPDDVGSVVPRILLPDGRIDSTGLVLDRYRRVRDRGQGGPAEGAYLAEEDVLGGTGAIVLHRRAMLDDVAVAGQALDENLFAYYDDLDLALRARRRGWRCRYVPSLVATHHRAARNSLRGLPQRATAGREQALTVRNRLLVMAKNERAGDVLRDLPWLVAFETARVGYLALRAPGALRGYLDAASGLGAALRDRREMQRTAGRAR
jgi:GT2 family glycosyltransferase